MLVGLVAVAGAPLAGCVSPGPAGVAEPDEYVLAFSVKSDYTAFVTDTAPLARWIEVATGVPTRILALDDESASILALAGGQAHAAFMDGGAAWIGWTTFGIEAIAADQHGDGRTTYTATAWVRADAPVSTMADLEGTRSCHTGELKSAGMLVPMGYLIREGLIDMRGLDPGDIASLRAARERFFSASTIGGEYKGALQCLALDHGDVAFVRDTTWDEYCGVPAPESWCLPRDSFRTIPDGGLAEVPSHPVMVAPGLPAGHRAALRDALGSLNDDAAGRAILQDVLNTPGIVAVETAEHLGGYGDVISHVPGIRHYLETRQVTG